MTTRPTPLPPRYGRLRLDGDLNEFHHAQNALAADTCAKGHCAPPADQQRWPGGGGGCGRHRERAERRRLRDGGGSP